MDPLNNNCRRLQFLTMQPHLVLLVVALCSLVAATPLQQVSPPRPAALESYKVERVLSHNEDPWPGGKQYYENRTVLVTRVLTRVFLPIDTSFRKSHQQVYTTPNISVHTVFGSSITRFDIYNKDTGLGDGFHPPAPETSSTNDSPNPQPPSLDLFRALMCFVLR